MIKLLIKWFRKFLEHHGFVVINAEEHFARITDYEDMIKKLQTCTDQLTEELNICRGRINAMDLTSMEELKEENDRLQAEQDRITAEMQKSEEYYKEVQKDLRRALHDDHMFSFARNMCFPGSSSVSCETIQEMHKNPLNFIVVCGRTTMDDEATAKLKTIPGINQKYSYCLNYLMRLGLVDKIAKNIINGGLALTLTYNEDCTTNEIYYEAKCMVPESGYLIQYDK